MDGLLRDPEGAANPNRGEFTTMDKSINGHLRNPHHRGNLGNGKETNLGKAALSIATHLTPNFLQAVRPGSPADA